MISSMVYLKKGIKGIIIKTTKRILALMTALVLCLAPMALMVGAAVINDNMVAPCGIDCDCVNPTYTTLVTGNPTYSIEVATATGCIIQYYDAMIVECNNCLARSVVRDCGKEFTHPTFIYGTENGITAYHCPRCSYYKY